VGRFRAVWTAGGTDGKSASGGGEHWDSRSSLASADSGFSRRLNLRKVFATPPKVRPLLCEAWAEVVGGDWGGESAVVKRKNMAAS
jgi:hypothetical protein